MKPRIRWFVSEVDPYGFWICEGLGNCGLGNTIQQAYRNWSAWREAFIRAGLIVG